MPVRDSSPREEHFSDESRAFLGWLRGMLGLRTSRRQLALYTGIPESTVSTWFGLGRVPKYEQMVALADYFGVAVSDIPGVTLPGLTERPAMSARLAELIEQLDPPEQQSLADMAETLLELRERRSAYDRPDERAGENQ